MATFVEDKSQYCIPFILKNLQQHRDSYQSRSEKPPPFFVGLQGVQGAGKTTLVETLKTTLSSPPHNFHTLVLSIDDLYLTHKDQEALAKSQPNNPLIQHRGQPSTHEIKLGIDVFGAIANRQSDIAIPSYDKSAFSGAGDRRSRSEWQVVNQANQPQIEIVILEGWCVGFRAVTDDVLQSKWTQARQAYQKDDGMYNGQLGRNNFASIEFVNSQLNSYDGLTDKLNCFIQIDAEDTQFVYAWRAEQETALRAKTGSGMTEKQVASFVNAYYPAYELYGDQSRRGIFTETGRQLRLVVNRDRKVQSVQEL